MSRDRRSNRLGRQLQAELGAIIENDLDDPRIGSVVVTGVRLSRDLAHARVFVHSVSAGGDPGKLIAGLESARGFLRRQLGLRLAHLRKIPDLGFSYDTSVDAGSRVEELLSELDLDDSADPNG